MSMTMLRHLTFALFAVGLTACTQETGSLGVQSAASTDDSDAADTAKRPPPAMADVVPLGDDGAPKLDGEHVQVPFFLPPPPKDDAATPPPCTLHRTSADDAPPAPPKDAPPPPKPDAEPPKDAHPGPLALQIAIFAAGDAAARPDVVVQCFGKPGEDHVSVPRDMLDEALGGLGAGAKARVVLAGFSLPPGDATAPDAHAPPPPPKGRGVFLDVAVTDASSLDAPLARIALPKP
jgi:hypothetical protein